MLRLPVSVGFAALVWGGLMPYSAIAAEESYRFTYRPAQVGDQSTQDVKFLFELKATIRQVGQIVYSTDRDIQHVQRRRVKLLQSADPRTSRARLTFDTARQTTTTDGRPAAPTDQPVAGKTYFVARSGEQLTITDRRGAIPPPEERRIVARAAESVGRPSPLGIALGCKTIAVGQTIRLPNRLAADLFGFDAVGEVARLEMRLVGTRREGPLVCAVMETRIDADSSLATSATMRIEGRLLVAIDTCRLVAAELSGPVTLSEGRGPAGGEFTVSGSGTMRVALHARHDQARR